MKLRENNIEFDFESYLKKFKPEPDKRVEVWTEKFEQMAVHFRKLEPVKLLDVKRPNEAKDIKEYRLSVYRPITYGSINKSFDSLIRMFSNFSFHISGNEDVLNYIENENFYIEATNEFHPFNEWVEKLVIKRMLEDANGIIIWLYKQIDETGKVMPVPYLLYSKDIIHLTEDYITFVSEETEAIGNKEPEKVYYCLDKENLYRFYKIAPDKYEYTIELTHNLGYVPIIVLGGDLTSEGIYESFFAPYCAFGDEAISQFSDWQAVMVQSGFPIREEITLDCDNPQCYGGISKDTQETCPRCNGKGFLVPRTPYGAIQRKMPSALDSNQLANFNIPAVRFISPDVNHVKLSNEVWEQLIIKAEESLHLTETNLQQSGVAKEYDREPREDMLSKIANNIYDNIYENSLKIIADYRKADTDKDGVIVIDKPNNYKIKSQNDLIEEIKQISESNAPNFFVAETVKQLAMKQFKTYPLAKKIYDFLAIYDPLFTYSQDIKDRMYNSGNTTKETYLKSMYAIATINEVVAEVSPTVFLSYEYNKIKELVDSKIKIIIDNIQAAAPVTAAPEIEL